MYQPNQPVIIVSAPASYPLAPGKAGLIYDVVTDPVSGETVYSVITSERVGVQPRVGRTGGDLYTCYGLRESDLRPDPSARPAFDYSTLSERSPGIEYNEPASLDEVRYVCRCGSYGPWHRAVSSHGAGAAQDAARADGEVHAASCSDPGLPPVDDEQAAVSDAIAAAGPDDVVIGGRGDGPVTLPAGNYYALVGTTGEMREGFTSEDAAARWLAERLGVPRSDLWLEDRSSSCRTVVQYDVLARSSGPEAVDGRESVGTIGCDPDDLSPADRRVADRIAALPEEEPPPGWEERAVERARAAGVIPD